MTTNDALVMVFARNAFYRKLYHLVLAALLLSWIIIGVLTWTLIFLLQAPYKPLYFATDAVSQLIYDIPVTQRNMANEKVEDWVIKAVQTAFSYDFINYHAQLQDAQKYFAAYGWSNYMRALRESNNLLALKNDQMVVNARVTARPTIIVEGQLAGAYAWKMRMPLLITYIKPPYPETEETGLRFSNAANVEVIVQRQKVLESYQGLGIVQVITVYGNASPQAVQQISHAPSS